MTPSAVLRTCSLRLTNPDGPNTVFHHIPQTNPVARLVEFADAVNRLQAQPLKDIFHIRETELYNQ